MAEPKEVTITLKDAEKRLSYQFLKYEEFQMRSDDPVIQACLAEAKRSFEGEPESAKAKVILEL